MQILKIRPDLTIKNLRGNVNTRIRKLKEGQYDAIILASSGIKRLGLQEEIKYFTPISEELMIPAMGQAALGIEIVDTPEVASIVEVLKDEDATVETTIEREFVRVLEGGCQVPIGINAKQDGDSVSVQALVGLPDGEEIIFEKLTCRRDEYKTKGEELAKLFIKRGAKELLKKAEHIAMTEVF